MRTEDWARGGVWEVGDYRIVKRSWEKQWDIFLDGRCVHSEKTKNDAVAWIKNQDPT